MRNCNDNWKKCTKNFNSWANKIRSLWLRNKSNKKGRNKKLHRKRSCKFQIIMKRINHWELTLNTTTNMKMRNSKRKALLWVPKSRGRNLHHNLLPKRKIKNKNNKVKAWFWSNLKRKMLMIAILMSWSNKNKRLKPEAKVQLPKKQSMPMSKNITKIWKKTMQMKNNYTKSSPKNSRNRTVKRKRLIEVICLIKKYSTK